MKKAIFLSFVSIVMLCLLLAACSISHTHEFGEWFTVKSATCIEEGVEERTCNCGEKETRSIGTQSHNIVKSDKVDPTCTEKGKTEGTYCSICGTIFTESADIPELGHNYEFVRDTATCALEGFKEYKCSVCGDVKQDNSEKKQHSYQSTVVKAAGCTTDGVRRYTCSVCNDSYDETIKATGHKFKSATCTEPKKCTSCGLTEGNALGHDYRSSITKQATCTSDGVETFKCSRCSDTYTKKIPGSHDYVDGECTKCGSYDDYLGCAIVAVKSYFQANLKNPNSLQLHSIKYYVGKNDKSYFYLVVEYSAMNGFGGYNRDTAYIYIHNNGDGTFKYSPYSTSNSATDSYSSKANSYSNITRFTDYYYS